MCVCTTDWPLFIGPSLCPHIPIFLRPGCDLQILTAEQQTAFCRIGAITRGFLIRRLLKTEKVKHLRQTIMVRVHTNPHAYTTNQTILFILGEIIVCLWVCTKCFYRIHRSSSAHSRLKLHRRKVPSQHKISPCRRELEPRYECVVTVCRQQRSIFLCVYMHVYLLSLSYVQPFMISMTSSLKCLWGTG